MASKTDIANIAAGAHQGAWLQNVDSDPGNFANALRAMWPTTLEFALAMAPWNFAKWSWRDQPSVPCEQNPDPEQPFFYNLPPDCVRCFRVPPGLDFFEWAGGISSAEGPTLTMIGVRRGVDVGRFSPTFCRYLGFQWAYDVCTAVNASEAIRKRCETDAEKALAIARNDNSKVGTIRRPFADSFIGARLTGGPVIPA